MILKKTKGPKIPNNSLYRGLTAQIPPKGQQQYEQNNEGVQAVRPMLNIVGSEMYLTVVVSMTFQTKFPGPSGAKYFHWTTPFRVDAPIC